MIASTVSYILQLTAASSVFPIDEENFPLVKTIRLVVQSVKSVAAYIQAIRTQLQIKNYIKAKFDTRWNSTLTMLQSFIENKSDIYSLLKSNEQEQGVENMDLSVVNTLIQFLEPFQKVTKVKGTWRWERVNHPQSLSVLLHVGTFHVCIANR